LDKSNLDEMLQAAKKDFKDKNMVAFIGKTYYGKTVVSTLLFDALTNDFLKKHKKKFHIKILDGFDEIDRVHRKIFTKGRFPPPTLPKTKSAIKIEIASKAQLGKKTEFVLRDASGEDIQKVLQEKYDGPDDLVYSILTKHKGPNDPYGPLSYLIFTKIYIILIDCMLANEWRTEQYRFNQIINSIFNIQKKIKGLVDNQIKNPIGIAFTKADELKNTLDDLKDTKTKISSEELIETYLPLLESNLESDHSGNLRLFQFSIAGVEEASTQESAEIAHEEAKELAELNQEILNKEIEDAKKDIQDTIDRRVKNVVEQARKKAIEGGQPEAEANKIAQKAGTAERVVAEEENKIEELEKRISDISSFMSQKKRYTISLPVKYSQREYTRFISWLIDNIS